MNRKFLTRFLICLVPNLLAGYIVANAFQKESHGQTGFRRGIDLAGGTILVYEVNLEKTLARKNLGGAADPTSAGAGLSSEDIRKLAENLKRRIDPNDLKNVIVRPVGTTRVEIILPFSGSTGGGKEAATEDFVQEVKALVRQVGVLEFRILANPVDDAPGIAAAKAAIDSADPKEVERRAKQGLPPRGPTETFTVTVNKDEQDGVTYEWVELGKEERESLGLSNAYEKEPPKKKDGKEGLWLYPVLQRQRGKAVDVSGMVLYSRDFVKSVPSSDEKTKKVEYFVLSRVSPTDVLKVDREVGLQARASTDQQKLEPIVLFSFNAEGARRLGKLTERNRPGDQIKRQMAILMDEKVVSAPNLLAILRDGGQISGNFRMEDCVRLANILTSGALNAELKPEPVSENTVGPTLGQDTIQRGLNAVGLAFGAVMLFMVLYYRFSGVVACVALLSNLLLTVGFMVAVQAAFTLPGLAGIVLMLGMAVDANVLIYERIREERAKGASLANAIRLGYDRAFATIIDTHLTSIFTALVLYTFGNDNLKGFAVSLTVGLVISLFTALYMTRLMFDYALDKRFITELRMHQLFPRPNFNFMAIRYQMLALTGLFTVVGLGVFLGRGEAALNVDFTKGTAYGGRFRPGEERALRTVGDKLGLLDLLDESRQKERLKIKEGPDGVVWMTKPEASTDPDQINNAKPAEYVYKIVYDDKDNSVATVTFANPPDGTTDEARLANVRERASSLPDFSVEQVFLTGQNFSDGKSQLFTIRTTEKEPDLVQVILDRLLRDEKTGAPLLDTTKATNITFDGPYAIVTFDKPTSPRYLKEFVTRELMLANRVPAQGSAPPVEVTPVETGDAATIEEEGTKGKYRTVRISVLNNPEFRPLRDAEEKARAEAEKAKAAKEKGGLLGAIAGAIAQAAPAPAAAPADPRAVEDARVFKSIVEKAVSDFSARPLPDRLETFDPALAADTRTRAFFVIMASWLAILGYLWFRFGSWTFGVAAVLCLIHDLCFTLGAIAFCHYLHDTMFGSFLRLSDFKIDLAAVAALLTLVGYSVNDTIVVFDRIREVRGKNPLLTPQMINDSVNQTLSRTVLASLTVFLVVGVLYFFGGEGVHLFSFVMVIGVIVGTYSSIYIASPLLLIFGEGHVAPNERRPTAPEPVATIG